MGEIQQQNEPPHVAVLAFPFGTHAAPLLTLTKRLATAAPHVTFSFFNTAKSNASLFSPKSKEENENITPWDVDDGVAEGYVFTGKRQEDIELFINATPGNFKEEISKAVSLTKKNITCLMTDAFLSFASDMAEEMNISWVPLWTSAAPALSAHLHTDLIRSTIGANPTVDEEQPLSFVPGMPTALRIKDIPVEIRCDNAESVFSRLLHKMAQTVAQATAIAINSFEELDPSVMNDLKSRFHQCLTVGPFNLTSPSSHHDPHGCLSWLSKHKPASVAYISFGTVISLPPPELAALAEALEDSGVPFLWSLKDDQKVHLPKGFLERTSETGMVVPWTPQSQVLQHTATGVFVTHCGWNSVMESTTGGVPMICRPFFGDQMLNARLISVVWEIGLEAKDGKFSKVGLMEDLDLILSKEQGERMRKKVVQLKNLARQAVEPNGSSTKNFNTLLTVITKT